MQPGLRAPVELHSWVPLPCQPGGSKARGLGFRVWGKPSGQ